ncbi:TonB-dependent receptor, partial [Rickettsiales bacterium]|nr:TonB-dependent receptor [Rickettsiales bacterium]
NKTKLTAIIALMASINSYANEVSPNDKMMERVMIIGNKENINNIAGSANFIDEEQLAKYNYTDINRILRQVPGVNLNEEEGFGNRPNIGFRGGRSERSADITLMEDGVLIAPAPYSASSAYYFPRASKMESVEVRKGSSTTEFGPKTTSGALNLITKSIPDKLQFDVSAGYGSFNTHKEQITHGNKLGNWSYLIDASNQQSDGFKKIDIVDGNSGYSIQDVMAKLKYETDDDAKIYQSVELKLGYNNEDSNETYLGLTDADFANDPYRRYAASQLDNMDAEHHQYQLRHFADFGNFDLTTTIYRNNFSRNWYKLKNTVTNNSNSNVNLKVRANNRDYYSQGIQSVLGSEFKTGKLDHKLKFSARFDQDQEDRFQRDDTYDLVNGQMVLTSYGAAGGAGNREKDADATAIYISDAITYNKLTLTPGLRYENIKLENTDYNNSANNNVNHLDVFIPSLGSLYKFNDNLSTFVSIHKGFNPPTPGSTDSKEERSTNYEAGLRYNKEAFATEFVAFFNDYSNLNGECTTSSGGNCNDGDQYSAGAVEAKGFEFSASYDLASNFANPDFKLPITGNYTFTDTEFKTNFTEVEFDEWGDVASGDELPYISKHQYFVAIGFIKPKWEINLNGKYVGKMRSVAGKGPIASGEKIDPHFIVDITSEFKVADKTKLFLKVENLFDEKYIVSRRPINARPGKPLSVMGGFKYKF